MKTLHTEVAVIGGGTAGMSAFRAALKHGADAYLIEATQFGTTCARVGCMPSKLLIAAAEAAHHAAHAAPFGIEVGGVRVDGEAVLRRVRAERDRFVGFVLEDVEAWPAERRLLGAAKFVDAHTLEVGGHTRVVAERIVIATGSRPLLLPEWQALGDKVVTNDAVFEWERLPESVAVFGSGVIGLELGQALARLGVRVAIFGKGGGLGGISDPVVRQEALETFGAELPLHLDAHTQVALDEEGRVRVDWQEGGASGSLKADYLLAAIGRVPNVDQLGLASLNLALDSRGVPKAHPLTLQTSLPHIFIAGDASNQAPLLHEAADQGVIAGNNAATFPNIQPGLRRSAIGVVFTEPQIASVGMRYKEVCERFKNPDCVVVGEVSFRNQGRSRVMRRNVGHLRLYAEQGSGRFLGAEMAAPAAEHLAHLLAWAHQQRLTVAQMLAMPFYHPVIEEGVRTALRDAAAKLKDAAPDVCGCATCPGG